MRESAFERETLSDIEDMFPGCIIMKQNPNYRQGMPDRVIYYQDRWAMLEFKASAVAHEQPNQAYYIDMCDQMGFAAFIYPENADYILGRLRNYFYSR